MSEKYLVCVNRDYYPNVQEYDSYDEAKMSGFIRYDQGKFGSHCSEISLLLDVTHDIIDNWYENNLNGDIYISLETILRLWNDFKYYPTKVNLLTVLKIYIIYIRNIDKEKLQSLSFNIPLPIEPLNNEQIFSVLYENHTIVSKAGMMKYGLRNWLKMQPSEVVRCIEPCERHMIYYPLVKGEIVDSENGLPHYMPTIWNLVAIYRVMLIDTEVCRKAILGEK